MIGRTLTPGIAGGKYKFAEGSARVLETAQERVKLLKAGFSGKAIEKLYLLQNSIAIVGVDWLSEVVD